MMVYIDPGTGAMLFSLATGLVSVAWYGARKQYMKLKYLVPGKVKAKTNKKDIVIYGEDKRYWTTFKGILDEFEKRQVKVTYLAGSEDDPLLSEPYQYVETEVIGLGNRAYTKLNFLNARIVLATTPGLDVYQWKRSKDVNFYVHMTHGIGGGTGYRMFGTEFYDAILYSSNCFDNILREIEKKRDSKEKEILTIGCTYMDYLMERKQSLAHLSEKPVTILLAPSWGECGILSKYGETFIDKLINTGFHIIFRPHPQSYISETEMVKRLKEKYPETEHFKWSEKADNFDVLSTADILISDFSGIIYDFAFIFEKPVIYTGAELDLSKTDHAWVEEPLWVFDLLPQLGIELKEDNFDTIGSVIQNLLNNEMYSDSIRAARDVYWQNRGYAAEFVANYLIKKNEDLSKVSNDEKDWNCKL